MSRQWESKPVKKRKPPMKNIGKPKELDPFSGIPWDVLRGQQAELKREFLERDRRRRAA